MLNTRTGGNEVLMALRWAWEDGQEMCSHRQREDKIGDEMAGV